MAGSILQQSLLSSLVLALMPLIRLNNNSDHYKNNQNIRWEWRLIVIGGLGCLLSALFVPVIFTVLIANLILFLFFVRRQSSQKTSRIQVMRYVSKSTSTSILILIPLICWTLFKLSAAENTYGEFNPFVSKSNLLQSYSGEVTKLQIAGGLISLSADVDGLDFNKSEIRTFGLGMADSLQNERCGFYNEGYPQAIQYSKNYFSPSCKNKFLWHFFVVFQPISLFFFRFFLIVSPMVFFYYLMKRNLRLACLFLPIIMTFGIYFFFGLGISRYMYAVWPATVFYFFTIFTFQSGKIPDKQKHPK
jgi:hypothetical protein